MKGFLIYPPNRIQEPPHHIPYGMAILAKVIDNMGEAVALFDNNLFRLPEEALRIEIRDCPDFGVHSPLDWDWIGIGGITSQYKFIKPYLKMLRAECPNAVIIAGGGFLTSQPKDIMSWCPEIDVGAIGEAEETIPEILDHVNTMKWSGIRGVIYREGKELVMTKPRPQIKDLDSIPYPAWNQLQLESTVEKGVQYGGYFYFSGLPLSPEAMMCRRRLDIISERGCPNNCHFCTHLGMSFRDLSKLYSVEDFKNCPNRYNLRFNSAKYVVEMIKEMRFKYSIDFISFLDENFTSNRKRALEICDLLEKEGLTELIHWGCLGDVTSVDGELLQRMKDTGCTYLSYGGESASQKMLDSIGKKQTPAQMQAAINITKKVNINPLMTFMMGYPHETINDILETVTFWIDNMVECAPFYITPYPNTDLYYENKEKILKQYNGKLEDFIIALGDAVDFVVNLSDWSDVELIGLRELMFRKDVKRLIKWAKEKNLQVDSKFLTKD